MQIEFNARGVLTYDSIDDPMAFWEASRRFFLARRSIKIGARGFRYPETTHDDVRQLATIWHMLHLTRWRADVSQAAFAARWRWAFERVLEINTGARPSDTFPRNEEFWLVWTKHQAIWISAAMNLPTRREQVLDAVANTAADLPGDVLDLATGVASGAADLAIAGGKKAAKVVTAPVRGLFDGLFDGWGRPLLIGALVVGGFVVVPRLLPSRTTTRSPEASP